MLSQEGAAEFLDRYVALINLISGGYKREGKRYLALLAVVAPAASRGTAP